MLKNGFTPETCCIARSLDISKIIISLSLQPYLILYSGRKFLSKVIYKKLNGCEVSSAKCVQS